MRPAAQRRSIRWLWCAPLAISLWGCALPADELGINDATRITFEAEVPVTINLPSVDLAPAPIAFTQPVRLTLPFDLIERLRETGRNADADLLEEQADRIEAVSLRSLEYEIADPNRLPADVEPVTLYLAPFGTLVPDASARPLGTTVAIDAERSVATRELTYTGTGKSDASMFLEQLRFTLIADTRISVEPGRPIPANAFILRLTFDVSVRVDLAR